MDIRHISGNAYYIDAPINIGMIINDKGEALLVDTGIDDSIARKVRRMVEEAGWVIRGLFLTHHHADHTGGAPFLVRATGATVYAGAAEKGFIEYPLTEPLYLFNGAAPPPALRNKFFQASGVKVDITVIPDDVLPSWGCTVIDLVGHSMGQIGLLSQSNVLYSADAVIGTEFLNKHGIPLNTDINQALTTYEKIEKLAPQYLLPAHGHIVSGAKELITANRTRVIDIVNLVKDTVRQQASWEDILVTVASKAGMRINNMGEYALANLSALAYLSYLLEQKFICCEYKEGRQFIYPIEG